jgi:hypothetical protein
MKEKYSPWICFFYRHWVENVDHIYYVETVSDMYLQGVTLDIIFVLQMY